MNANLPQPAGPHTSPPAFGIPLSARGEGERGGEVGITVRGGAPRRGDPRVAPTLSPMLQRRAGTRRPLARQEVARIDKRAQRCYNIAANVCAPATREFGGLRWVSP